MTVTYLEYKKEFQKLGKRYKKLRLQRGMVQFDVLEHNFSIRHYQQLEAGRPHSLITFFRLSEMFEVKPEDLIRDIYDTNNCSKKKQI